MTDYEGLRVLRHERVAEIELSRPELRNRIDELLHGELTAAFAEAAADPQVLAVVLTSTGKQFSAGGDVESMIAASGELDRRMAMIDDGRQLFHAVADFPKPLVVALHGDVYGLGASIVLLADAVVTTPTVRIADPHVRMGLVPGDGGCVAWPLTAGLLRAKRHLLTGDPLTGQEAYTLGLVTDLVETADDVRTAALALAQRIAGLPPLAVQLTKRALNKFLSGQSVLVLDHSFYLEALTFGSEDLREAVAAFKEKRDGNWVGR
jgi:enoyl-CoA hydratase